MQSLVLAALLSVAGSSTAQDQSVHVTYTTRAARASVVLKDLSQASKLDLQTTPQTQGEILVVSVKDVPISDVMARIASATSAEWKQEGTTYRLVPSLKIRAQEEKADLARRIANIQKGIKARKDQEKKMEEMMSKAKAAAKAKAGNAGDTSKKGDQKADEEDDVALAMGGQSTGPNDETIEALLGEADIASIAELDAGDRVVFSTDPTRTQKPLGPNTTEIVNAFIQKHNATVIPADAAADAADVANNMDAKQAEFFRNMMRKQNSKIGQVAKALLVVSDSSFGSFSQLHVEMRLYDAKGTVVYSGISMFSEGDEDMFAGMEAAMDQANDPNKKPEKAEPPTKQTPIEFSADTKAFQDATKGMATGQFNLQLPTELRQKLFLPNQYDPLSYADTDVVLAYAKAQGKPLVADLPDTSDMGLNAFSPGVEESKTVEDVAKQIEKGANIALVPDQAFVVLKPAEPFHSRQLRVDRNALTALMQAADEKSVPSLDDIANYAKVSPNPMGGGFSQGYLMLFVPGAMQMGMDAANWDMLRIYANLTEDARATLTKGGKLTIGSLPTDARTALERMTYGANNHLSVVDPQHKSEDEDQPSWMQISTSMGMDSKDSDYRNEPTEVVPNGLPNDGYIELHGTSEPFASPVGNTTSIMMAILGTLGPDELAMFKTFRTMKGAEALQSMFPSFPKLRVGDRSVLNFTFHLAPQVVVKQTLKDHHLDKNAPICSEDNLPADFQKKIAERTEQLKKSPFGALGGMFGGGAAIHP